MFTHVFCLMEEYNLFLFRSVESPRSSSEYVNQNLANRVYDSDLEVEDLPSLKLVLGEDVCKKLKPKEKKRQDVLNGECFRRHLCSMLMRDGTDLSIFFWLMGVLC